MKNKGVYMPNEKQIWEMTKDEYEKAYGKPKKSSLTGGFHPHKEAVMTALNQGKKVPPKVLKDYPELGTTSVTARHVALNLWKGSALDEKQKKFLSDMYDDYTAKGELAVAPGRFNDKTSYMPNLLHELLAKHPKVEDEQFLKKLSIGNEGAADEVITKGPKHFSTEVYEKLYSDSMPGVYTDDLKKHGLEGQIKEVERVMGLAFSDGVVSEIDRQARKALQKLAGDFIKDLEVKRKEDKEELQEN